MMASQQQRARQMALAMRSQMVLSGEDEEVLWWVLQRHASVAAAAAVSLAGGDSSGDATANSQRPAPCLCLNYDAFTQVAAECRDAIGPSVDMYFQASTFLRLTKDEGGCVPVAGLFRYCLARSAQIQLRVELGVLDSAGTGALSPAQLQQWLLRHAPLAACSECLVSDADWCTAVAARLLLLHCRRGRLPVKDLVASQAVNELSAALHALEAAEAAVAAAAAEEAGGGESGSDAGSRDGGSSARSGSRRAAGAAAAALAAAQQQVAGSWFSPAAVAALRSRFAELDADRDGRLSEQEFAGFSQGTMTRLAIQRLFSQHCPLSSSSSKSWGGAAAAAGGGTSGSCSTAGMDFAAFCTFVAAWEERHQPAAARYFFPLLDVRGVGYLGQADLYCFFREVHSLWVSLGQYAELRVEDVLAEVADLLQAPDPQRITLADLQRCGAAGTVIGLLLDVNQFWEYENREMLLQQQQQAGAGDTA